MTLCPVFHPVRVGDDIDFLFFGEFTNGSQEMAYGTSSNADQNCRNSTASIVSNFSEISSSHPPSPLVESPTAGTCEFQSSATGLESFHFSRYGDVNEDEMWQVHSGGSSEGLSVSAIVETVNTQQVHSGEVPPRATNYQETHDHTAPMTPFDFVPSIPLPFRQSTHNGALWADMTGLWRPEPMIQGSSFEFPEQGPHAIYCPTLDISSNRSTTSTATQTSDDLAVDCTPPRECSPPTRSPSIISKTSVTQRASRNFPCEIDGCTRSYTRKFELSRHLKRHSGLKEHHCRFSTCAWAPPNGFTRKDHLKQHLRQVHKTSA